MNEFCIVVVGVGEIGILFLKQLLILIFVKVLGVVDLDFVMLGIVMVREYGVKVSNDFMDFFCLGKEVDVIIDVIGVFKVWEIFCKYMVEIGNDYILIMYECIVLLMMFFLVGKLVLGKYELLEYN